MPHDDQIVNPSTTAPFEEILQVRLKRRGVLTGGAALAATTFLAATPVDAAISAATTSGGGGPLIGFEPVPLGFGDVPNVSPDYQWSVAIPWGTPLRKNGPEFSWPQTSARDQERQVGIGHDGMWFFPKGGGSAGNRRGVLCINHEFGRNTHVFGKSQPESLEDVRISQAAHGISVLEIRRRKDRTWGLVPGKSGSKRITVNSQVRFSGPAAGSEYLETAAGNKPTGTLNNCAYGVTPWGTYLTCEENFNGYFGDSTADPDTGVGDWTPTPEQARYGFDFDGFGYGWEKFDPRFDLSRPEYANTENGYGWVVEVDPYRRSRKPVKRTALGRVKHEGAAVAVGKGNRAVVYMGDDQRFDYIYKFVSSGDYEEMLDDRMSPLDHGVLYVARFDADGTGEWLELSMDNPVVAAEFSSQAQVVTFARMAADLVGATPMDRPEWTTVAPDGHVYCTLTNNSRRTVPDAANPEAPNLNGHIIRWMDSEQHTGTTFEWDIFLLASSTHGGEDGFGSPDGLWADPDGRIFIQTDGAQPDGANDQMLVADPSTGDIRRLFTAVPGSEVTGIAVTPDRRTMFINIQHPGNGNPDLTLFPDYTDGVVPRDATVVLTRKDGGIIGS